MIKRLLPLMTILCCPVLMAVEPVFDDSGEARLDKPFAEEWSVGCDFRVAEYPDGGMGVFDKDNPLSIFQVVGDSYDPSVLVRLNKKKLEVVIFQKGPDLQQVAGVELVLVNEPCQVVVTVKGTRLEAWLNGRRQLVMQSGYLKGPFNRIFRGRHWKQRRFRGELANIWYLHNALDAKEIVAKCPQAIAARPPHAINIPNRHGVYPSLKVAGELPHTWHDMHDVNVTPLAWFDPHGRDLLAYSPSDGLFGIRTALFKFLYLDKETGMPVYDTGKTLLTLTGGRHQAYRWPDGSQSLFSNGQYTSAGSVGLVERKIMGRGDAMEFGKPQEIPLSGPLPNSWHLFDVEGDGTPDLFCIIARKGGSGWPYGENPWQNKELENMGPGRGYDLTGKWLGTETIYGFQMARGQRDENGRLSFGKFTNICLETPGFPLQWKSYTMSSLAVHREGNQLKLLIQGNLDEVRCLDLEVHGDQAIARNSDFFLKDHAALRHAFLTRRLSFVDIDLDGQDELLTDGNIGRIPVMKGSKAGDYREIGCAMMAGGPVACDTLVAPCRVDWDGDGLADLLTGDAAGNVLFWKGTANPLEYLPAQPFTVNGTPVFLQAGPNGSIQGEMERRWGYTKVAAFDWDGDGISELLVNDIIGKPLLYRRAAGDDPLALDPPKPFIWKDKELLVSWRSRPDMIPAKLNFANCGRNALLFVDWDGDAAVGIPAKAGGMEFESVTKLRYEDGATVRLCGVCGHWGRVHVSVVDLDGDGAWDIVFGTNGSCHPAISRPGAEIPRGRAMPVLLRNIGTNEKPVFANPTPITLSDGTMFNFHTHCATPWFSDMTGHGTKDMLIGAEDGKVYVFKQGEYTWKNAERR